MSRFKKLAQAVYMMQVSRGDGVQSIDIGFAGVKLGKVFERPSVIYVLGDPHFS